MLKILAAIVFIVLFAVFVEGVVKVAHAPTGQRGHAAVRFVVFLAAKGVAVVTWPFARLNARALAVIARTAG